MGIRKKTMKEILDPTSKIDSNISKLFLDILEGKSISTVCQLSHYATKRSFDQALYQQGCLNLFSCNIIYPLQKNEVALELTRSINIEDDRWKKMSNLPSIVDELGFRIHGSKVSQNIYGIVQKLECYQYTDIIEFVEISSSSVLRRILKIDAPEDLSNSNLKDNEEINYWDSELKKVENQIDKTIQSPLFDNSYIIEILKRLIDISCKKNMVYYLPRIVLRMATCYYYIGAYTDSIAMFDFGFSIAKYTKNSIRCQYLASTWIASSIGKILCLHTHYFAENRNEFDEMYDTVKYFNRKAFEDYYHFDRIEIQPMWNLCYLELSLASSYHKTEIEKYEHRMNLAVDRLYDLIHIIKRKKTNFSESIKSEIIQDFRKLSKNMSKISDDFIDLFHQFSSL
jgi:hypothetical protein